VSLALAVVLGLLIGVALGAVLAGRAAGGPDRPRGDRRVVDFE
jgi:hypothetical protein